MIVGFNEFDTNAIDFNTIVTFYIIINNIKFLKRKVEISVSAHFKVQIT